MSLLTNVLSLLRSLLADDKAWDEEGGYSGHGNLCTAMASATGLESADRY